MAGQRCQVCGGKVVNGRCSLCGMPYRNDEVLYHLNEAEYIIAYFRQSAGYDAAIWTGC